MVHIAKSHALALLRLPCYFVKLDTKIIGLFATQEQHESLVVASLGVEREFRRLGIGTYILGYIETIAKRMSKRWLETLVLCRNVQAYRLYTKFGFVVIQGGRDHYMLRKEIA
jgi:ribosomal protein S18 acetylase RimI-like enzyme